MADDYNWMSPGIGEYNKASASYIRKLEKGKTYTIEGIGSGINNKMEESTHSYITIEYKQ